MKQVQDALRAIGIPVFAGVWRATSAQQNPPAQYCVYSTTTTEAAHEDDCPSLFRTYVYASGRLIKDQDLALTCKPFGNNNLLLVTTT